MKKILSLTLAALLLLGFMGCTQQELLLETSPPVTESTGTPQTTAPPETTVPATDPTEAETTQSTEPSEVTDPTESTEATEGTEPTQPQKPKENTGKQDDETKPTDPPATEPTQSATGPADPPATQPPETIPPETQPPETEPVETQPPATEPPATEPPSTQPTKPAPTEPAGCQHDWMCVHHDEEGHWRAGIMCDCGWVAYGNPDELVAKWNTHSASYSAAEALFDHGGFGCMDEWIVDKPAYDEWVCRHCGEQKP